MTSAPEFPRPVPVEALQPGAPIRGEATAEELAALARRFSVPGLDALRFEAVAEPWGPGGWRVSGAVEGRLRQTCVVTLEPIETTLSDRFERFFAPERRLEAAAALLDPDLEEDVEPLGAVIDMGEIAAESAALAIDPYPRAPGVAFEGVLAGPAEAAPLTDEAARPFAGLAALRRGGDA